MAAISGDLTKLDNLLSNKKRSRIDDDESLSKKRCKQGVCDVFTADPLYQLCGYLCECALDWSNTRKCELYEDVNVVSFFKMKQINLDAEKTQTCTLHIIFKAYLPADKTTQTFQTTIQFRSRRTIQIVIAYVGQDYISDFPTDYISDSDDDDEDYGSDCEVSQLNPGFLKMIPKEKSSEKSPEKGPTYRPTYRPSQLQSRHRHSSLYKQDSELSKEIERFKTDVENSGGFEVGCYPLMDQAGIPGTWICKYYDIENKPLPAYSLTKLLHLSQLALCFYNMKEDAKFGNVKVLKAMMYSCGNLAYNITFEASLTDKDVKIFQTNVCTSIALPVEKITVEFVRIKPN